MTKSEAGAIGQKAMRANLGLTGEQKVFNYFSRLSQGHGGRPTWQQELARAQQPQPRRRGQARYMKRRNEPLAADTDPSGIIALFEGGSR